MSRLCVGVSKLRTNRIRVVDNPYLARDERLGRFARIDLCRIIALSGPLHHAGFEIHY